MRESPKIKPTSNSGATTNGSVLRGYSPSAGQLERIIANRNRGMGPLMTYGGRDFTGQGPYDL